MNHTDFLTGARIAEGEDVVALLLRPSQFIRASGPLSPAHLLQVASLPLAGKYDPERFLAELSPEAQLCLVASFSGNTEMTSLEKALDPYDHLDAEAIPADYTTPHVALLKKQSFELLLQVGALGAPRGLPTVRAAIEFYEDAVNQVSARRDGDPMKEHFEACLCLEGSTCYFTNRKDPRSAIETPIPFWFFNHELSMQDFARWDHSATAALMHKSEENRYVLFQGLLDLQFVYYGMLELCRQFVPSMLISDDSNTEALKALAELMREQAS